MALLPLAQRVTGRGGIGDVDPHPITVQGISGGEPIDERILVPNPITGVLMPLHEYASNAVFVAGAPNAAATLIIPAGGGGIRGYLTFLRISRIATAALAGGAILTITTTNLNAWQLRTGNAMLAGGTTDLINVAFPKPLAGASTNTGINFVAPAPGAAVSWDMEAHFFYAAG